jgi:hypothetical protein
MLGTKSPIKFFWVTQGFQFLLQRDQYTFFWCMLVVDKSNNQLQSSWHACG